MSDRGLDKGAWNNYPRVCEGCGLKLTLKDTLWLESVPTRAGEQLRSWHFACRLNRQKAA